MHAPCSHLSIPSQVSSTVTSIVAAVAFIVVADVGQRERVVHTISECRDESNLIYEKFN